MPVPGPATPPPSPKEWKTASGELYAKEGYVNHADGDKPSVFFKDATSDIATTPNDVWQSLWIDYVQNPFKAQQLFDTGNATLVCNSDNAIWGIGSDGKGENQIGLMLMQIREKIISPVNTLMDLSTAPIPSCPTLAELNKLKKISPATDFIPAPPIATATFKGDLAYDHEKDLKKKKKSAEEMQEETCDIMQKKLQRENKEGYKVEILDQKVQVTDPETTTSEFKIKLSKKDFPDQTRTITETRTYDPKTGLITATVKPPKTAAIPKPNSTDLKGDYEIMAENELTIRLKDKKSKEAEIANLTKDILNYENANPFQKSSIKTDDELAQKKEELAALKEAADAFKPKVIAVTVDDPRGEIIDREITVHGTIMKIKDISEKQADALEAFLTTFDAVEFNGTMYISPKPDISYKPSGIFHDSLDSESVSSESLTPRSDVSSTSGRRSSI